MSADPQPNSREASRPALHPVDWTVETGAVDDVLEAMEASLARRRVARRAQARLVTSAFAAAALVAAAFMWQRNGSTSDGEAVRSAFITQPERRVLPDGSVVELRHGARVMVDFSDALRRVQLVQGEAHFQVAKNPERPFVVAAGGVEVRAVGTAFAVEFGAKAVEVLVTEGRVSVASGLATESVPAAPWVYLDAGHNAVVDLAPAPTVTPPQIAALTPADIGTRLAWRVPRLEFSGTPLAEALALIRRHQPVRVELADASLGEVRVSGILRADNVANLWRLLEEQHGIRVVRQSDDTVVLSRGR
jgi:transmembrane sensor